MEYRKLGGATGIRVSEIGFGAWGIGGSENGDRAYGPTDSEESKRALRSAYEAGVNFYDTSDFYGFGRSEELIGTAFADVRDRVVIATKVGLLDADGRQDFSEKHIVDALEQSLNRLQSDYIDLYQLHSPSLETLADEEHIIPVLKRLREQGKIRAFGLSARSPEEGVDAIKKYGFEVVQVNFNLVDQRAIDTGLLALCQERQVGVIARTPLCFGFLTGKYTDSMEYHHLDHRSKWSREQIRVWANAVQLFTQGLVDKENQTHAQVALRFCLSFQGISTTIPGMLNRTHVNENVLASSLGALKGEELAEFLDIYKNHSFFIKS